MTKAGLTKFVGAAVIVAAGIIVFSYSGVKPSTSITDVFKNNTASPRSCGGESAIIKVAVDPALGKYLTDANCRTLYVYAKDKPSESVCVDDCIHTWLPFLYDTADLKAATDPTTKLLNVIKRKEGGYQYSFSVKPLYYYAEDKNPGDVKGNGGDWAVVIMN